MYRMRNVDGHLGWIEDQHGIFRSPDGMYAITYMVHDNTYDTYIAYGESPKGIKMYSRHGTFNSFKEAAHWCEMHHAVGAGNG